MEGKELIAGRVICVDANCEMEKLLCQRPDK